MKTNTIVGIVIDLKKKVAIAIFKVKSNLKRDIIFTLKGPHNIKSSLQKEEMDLRVLQMR